MDDQPLQAVPATPTGNRGEVTVEELSREQQTVARRMAEAKATVPEFTLATEVDLQDATELAGEATLADLVVKAAGVALRAHPRANASYRDGRVERYGRVNVGLVIATGDALVTPTIFDADSKPLAAIAEETRRLAARVRDGSITSPELSGATFTVSLLDVPAFAAIITPPHAAALAVGSVQERAVARDGQVAVRQAATATLTCDHRLLYGAAAAAFLERIRVLLEDPAELAR
jgi:pyruvate dehydrogenase E2 component (dihydrolipoamide acetyltransferase)